MRKISVPRKRRSLSALYFALLGTVFVVTLFLLPSFDDSGTSVSSLVPEPRLPIVNSPQGPRPTEDLEEPEEDPEELEEERQLWDVAAQQRRILSSLFRGQKLGSDALNHSLRRQLEEIPQCAALGPAFLDYLHKYLLVHYYSPDTGSAPSASESTPPSRIIYSCESHKPGHGCNGLGDRARGITSVFWLALLSRRRFELYHPSPVSMQKYMPPYLVNYIPTWSNASGHASMHSAKSYRESISPLITSVPVSFVMHFPQHKDYFRFQKEANMYVGKAPERGSEKWWRPQYVVRDIRIQTYSMGFDGFLSWLPELQEIKSEMLGIKRCNIYCYSGCLNHVLFQPDERLWGAAVDIIRSSNEPELIRRVDGLQRPPPGLVIPLVGLQLRMGGALAKDLRIPEPVRTFPWMLPHYYSLVTEVVTGAAWRNRPGLFPKSYALRDWFTATGGAARPVSLFVTSDSRQVVAEVLQMASGNNSNTLRVLHDARDMYLHTDTLNQEDFNAIATKYGIKPSQVIDRAYFNTLVAHYLLSISAHLIIARSSFGETAFWRGRQVASIIKVNVTSQQGTQMHQMYRRKAEKRELRNGKKCLAFSFVSLRRVLVDMHLPPTPLYAPKQ